MSKQITTIIIIAIVCLGLGYTFGSMTNPTDTFQAGWDAAKQRLTETGFAPLIEDTEITSVSGEIQEIKDNKISLAIYHFEPLSDPELDNRIIEIDENTKIYQLVEKDQAQFQKEMDEFDKAMQEAQDISTPPEPYFKREINFSNIEVGQRITAVAQEDIKEVKQFKAIEINVEL
jgi:hypothetical protein